MEGGREGGEGFKSLGGGVQFRSGGGGVSIPEGAGKSKP
jgi:hypothetical protein